MKKLASLFLFFTDIALSAQNTMHITYKDSSHQDVPIELIDSITFIEKSTDLPEPTLIGRWFWGGAEEGYYELLTFNEDKSYTGYDYYTDYNFDTRTYGTYAQRGSILYLHSNGIGYRRIHQWYIIGMATNALEVMTPAGSFIYYRLQPETIHLKVGKAQDFSAQGKIVYTDGITTRLIDGKLQARTEGTTYILLQDSQTSDIVAYKVIVEPS